jgi:hypothetical protein
MISLIAKTVFKDGGSTIHVLLDSRDTQGAA